MCNCEWQKTSPRTDRTPHGMQSYPAPVACRAASTDNAPPTDNAQQLGSDSIYQVADFKSSHRIATGSRMYPDQLISIKDTK